MRPPAEAPPPLPVSVRVAKRTFDVAGSALLLLLTWPMGLLIPTPVALGVHEPKKLGRSPVRV